MDVLVPEASMPWLVTDAWGNIDELNEAAAALLNRPPAWLRKKPLVLCVPVQERYGFRVRLHRLGQGERLPAWDGHLQLWQCPPLSVVVAVDVLPPPHALFSRLVWRVHVRP